MGTERRIRRLVDSGFRCVDEMRAEEALAIGRNLLRLRHTSGFEILARAHEQRGELEKAVGILQEGVETAPAVWRLWELLGNYRSDLGLFEEAREAYGKALACTGVDASEVHLNRAIALSREDRWTDALDELGLVADERLRVRAEAQRMTIMNSQGRHEEVLRSAQDLLAQGIPEGRAAEAFAAVRAELAVAIWESQPDVERALDCDWRALDLRRHEPRALWLIREICGAKSPLAKYLRLVVEGDWDEPADDGRWLGFLTRYDAVAEDAEEALEYVRPFEPARLRKSLRLHEWADVEATPDEPKGVYFIGPYCLFPRERGGPGAKEGNLGDLRRDADPAE